MNKQEKFEILEERNKQNELTLSFVKSISLIITALLAFIMTAGLVMMQFFDTEFLDVNNLTDVFGDLRSFLILVITLIAINIGGLLWFARGEVLGFVGYMLTNLVFAVFFGLWVITEFEAFALLLLLFFLSFSFLVGFYGLRKIKFQKEIAMYQD